MDSLKNTVLSLSEEERQGMCTTWLDQLRPVDLLRYVRGNGCKKDEARNKLLQRLVWFTIPTHCSTSHAHLRKGPIVCSQCKVAQGVQSCWHIAGALYQHRRILSQPAREYDQSSQGCAWMRMDVFSMVPSM
jgi:hypothetical protein